MAPPKEITIKLPLGTLARKAFCDSIVSSRKSEGESVKDFTFNKTRCRLLSKCEIVKENSAGIIYWMRRDCRVQDNWAMLYAQRMALKHEVPLHVCFFYKDTEWLYPTKRQFHFLLNGLKEVSEELESLKINFYLMNSTPRALFSLFSSYNIGCILTDFFPLRQAREMQEKLIKSLPEDVPFVEVDAHNIVPTWIASDKQEVGARTLRPKITKLLPEYLTEYPAVTRHPHQGEPFAFTHITKDIDDTISRFKSIIEVEKVDWAGPGSFEGLETLRLFISNKLEHYNERNDPTKNSISNLSPWLHFGQISAQRCALEARKYENKYKAQVESFLEELIVRRELSDNFCYYNDKYDQLEGASNWAQQTLNLHKSDKRQYIYSRDDFVNAKTHDRIWNAAQIQLLREGKIHGYMRMYWAKKILEWTKSPEDAIEIAQWLNDTYGLDGNDPNGFVGVMWSICGVHDQGWKERDIFGKIRFMVDYSMEKKFNVDAYCGKYQSDGGDGLEVPEKKLKSSGAEVLKKRQKGSDSKVPKKKSKTSN